MSFPPDPFDDTPRGPIKSNVSGKPTKPQQPAQTRGIPIGQSYPPAGGNYPANSYPNSTGYAPQQLAGYAAPGSIYPPAGYMPNPPTGLPPQTANYPAPMGQVPPNPAPMAQAVGGFVMPPPPPGGYYTHPPPPAGGYAPPAGVQFPNPQGGFPVPAPAPYSPPGTSPPAGTFDPSSGGFYAGSQANYDPNFPPSSGWR